MLGDRYFVKTFGCKANLFDSQQIEAELQKRGWNPAPFEDHPDIKLFIVNSCTVTDEADKQSKKAAQRASKKLSQARVLFTGCSAEANPEASQILSGVSFVVGNRQKPDLVRMAIEAMETPLANEGGAPRILGQVLGYDDLLSSHPNDREWPTPERVFDLPLEMNSSRTRTFLKIQEGCNSFCTFCIIPYGRGPSRSLSTEGVVGQIQGLVEAGVKEVVLTGTNLGDFGVDWGGDPQIENLCEEILSRTELQRLRLSSLDPSEISDKMLDLMARLSPRLCPHFHVSLQSPSSKILKLMKRRYTTEVVENRLRAIDNLGQKLGSRIFVGMDLISGFPGESSQDFEETVAILERLPWGRLHVFPYSERTGTPATRLPGVVPGAERKRRARILQEMSLKRMRAHYEAARPSFSEIRNVLVEGSAKGPDPAFHWVSGYSPEYLRVLFRGNVGEITQKKNQIVTARPLELWTDPVNGDVAFLADL